MLLQITSVHVKKAITTPRGPQNCQRKEFTNCRNYFKMNIQQIYVLSVIEIRFSLLRFQASQPISDSYKFTPKPKQQISTTKAEILMKSHDSFKEAPKNRKICYKNMRLDRPVSVDQIMRIYVLRNSPLPMYSSAVMTESWKQTYFQLYCMSLQVLWQIELGLWGK